MSSLADRLAAASRDRVQATSSKSDALPEKRGSGNESRLHDDDDVGDNQ